MRKGSNIEFVAKTFTLYYPISPIHLLTTSFTSAGWSCTTTKWPAPSMERYLKLVLPSLAVPTVMFGTSRDRQAMEKSGASRKSDR